MIERRGESDGERVGGEVLKREETAEQEGSGEGAAEDVERGGMDELEALDGGSQGECAEAKLVWGGGGAQGGEQSVEHHGPEDRATIFDDPNGKTEGDAAEGQAGGDQEQRGYGISGAAHGR